MDINSNNSDKTNETGNGNNNGSSVEFLVSKNQDEITEGSCEGEVSTESATEEVEMVEEETEDELVEHEEEDDDVDTGTPSYPVRKIVLIVFVFQVITLIFLLGKLSLPGNQNLMLLETPVIIKENPEKEDLTIRREDIIDTVTLMSGSQVHGRSDENKFRQEMKFDSGQMMWLVLVGKVETGDQLLEFAKIAMSPTDYEHFRKNVQKDDILNLFYDLGEKEENFVNNWREVGVNELKIASLLPWKKKIDFIVISCFDERHMGGLPYIIRINPGLPVFCPPITKSTAVKNMDTFNRAVNLIPLPPGYTRLTGKLGAYITPILDENGENKTYELDLIVQLREGVAILAGAGKMEPLQLVKDVTEATGQKVLYYIGGTNLYIGTENPQICKEIEEIKEIAPDIKFYPNFNTSLLAHQICEEIFGDQYHRVQLGTRINLEGAARAQKTSKTVKNESE